MRTPHIASLLIAGMLLWLLPGCRATRQITPSGLGFIQLGDAMPAPGRARLRGHDLRDTLFNEGGFVWRAAVMQYPGGKVYIEEDFVAQQRVNRIRIESSDLRYRKHIHTGMTLGELRGYYPEWQVVYLPAYGYWDLSALARPSIHYLLPASDTTLLHGADGFIPVGALPSEARVRVIVVM
ncbi:MAG: hypothetical protein OHK0039_45810 [Bacteroidia bacterium]